MTTLLPQASIAMTLTPDTRPSARGGHGGSDPSNSFALAFCEAGLFGRGGPTSFASDATADEKRPVEMASDIDAADNTAGQMETGISTCREGGAFLARPVRTQPDIGLGASLHTSHHAAFAKPSEQATTLSLTQRSVPSPSSASPDDAPSVAEGRSTRLDALRARMRVSALLVAVQSTEQGLRVFARAGRITPTERERLRHSVSALLAEHGFISADINIALTLIEK